MVPAFTEFTFHWYEGAEPPLVGVAEKVTEVPKHTWLADPTIDTLTGSSGFTIIVTALEVAGLPVAQVALEVNSHETMSLLIGM